MELTDNKKRKLEEINTSLNIDINKKFKSSYLSSVYDINKNNKKYINNIKRLEKCKEPLDKDVIIDHLSTILWKLDYDLSTCNLCGWSSHEEENWVTCQRCNESICEICSGWAIHNNEKCNKKYSCLGRSYESCSGLEYSHTEPKVLCPNCSLEEEKKDLSLKDDK